MNKPTEERIPVRQMYREEREIAEARTLMNELREKILRGGRYTKERARAAETVRKAANLLKQADEILARS